MHKQTGMEKGEEDEEVKNRFWVETKHLAVSLTFYKSKQVKVAWNVASSFCSLKPTLFLVLNMQKKEEYRQGKGPRAHGARKKTR